MKNKLLLIILITALSLAGCGKSETNNTDNTLEKERLDINNCMLYELKYFDMKVPKKWTVDDGKTDQLRFYDGNELKLLVIKSQIEQVIPDYPDYDYVKEFAKELAEKEELVVNAESFSIYDVNHTPINGIHVQFYSDKMNKSDTSQTIDSYSFCLNNYTYEMFMPDNPALLNDIMNSITIYRGEKAGATLESIEASYNGSSEEGTVINQDSDFEVIAVYSDGFREAVDEWQIKEPITLQKATTSKAVITYNDKSVEVIINCAVPMEYSNALKKAQSYSDNQYMSKNRLYEQLTSSYGEGFAPEAAEYAVANVQADWNYNALQKAKSYQQNQNMSKNRIYEQLISEYGEGFTPEQAQYAVDHLEE